MSKHETITGKVAVECVWDFLIDSGIATAEEVELVTTINGYNIEALESILFARTGYRSFDQLDNED